jgi:hypothetical protein
MIYILDYLPTIKQMNMLTDNNIFIVFISMTFGFQKKIPFRWLGC